MNKIEEFDNNTKIIYEFINKLKLIDVKKIDEVNADNKLLITYYVDFFKNTWFTYDFMIYASKCYKNFKVMFFNQSNNCVTKEFVNDQFSLDANNIERLCRDNHLNFGITYLLNQRGFTAFKPYGKELIVFTTYCDERGVDLNANIESVIANYLIYTQSEHIFSIIKNNQANIPNNIINLSSGYMLITHMLSLEESIYDKFYVENIQWIEKSFDYVIKDKKYWQHLLIKIEEELIKIIRFEEESN